MSRIDYSKWDNIDTDSDTELKPEPKPKPKSEPKPKPNTAPTPPAPQAAVGSAQTATPANEGKIPAVILRCEKEKQNHPPWSAVNLASDHLAFEENPVSPISALIEVPLMLHRVHSQFKNQWEQDNQIATYLMIDPITGFAPPQWQSWVGTVLAVRADRKPLLPHHLEGVWMYCDRILDIFGDGNGAPQHLYNRKAFEEWWEGYARTQKRNRPGKGGDTDPDDWRAVKSPYEM
ncbi:uncharacterized protein GGS25DRAFT_254408 [Hypoxylon fragiforme]|uniref:uncharacterized protein n=1 Tax=Hypoxylon fragiforme TaxID=63214 RepID=UPI0020C62818|nr:uncharacterized protein GGS25DRAFT_254408 [Hypoxylon fragiforme]KAI2610256.1 hypothetical protein GGS25DRAFT_254408 [Hypoxylon fragiforme]